MKPPPVELTRIVPGFELEVARIQGRTIRRVPVGDVVVTIELHQGERGVITAVEWRTGPPGNKLVGRCAGGCHWLFEVPMGTWLQKGKTIAAGIGTPEALLRRMRARSKRRVGS